MSTREAISLFVLSSSERDYIFELSENEPVYITKNGYGSRVLMNIQTYNYIKELLLDVQLEEYYQRSEVDGRNVDANEFLKRLMNE